MCQEELSLKIRRVFAELRRRDIDVRLSIDVDEVCREVERYCGTGEEKTIIDVKAKVHYVFGSGVEGILEVTARTGRVNFCAELVYESSIGAVEEKTLTASFVVPCVSCTRDCYALLYDVFRLVKTLLLSYSYTTTIITKFVKLCKEHYNPHTARDVLNSMQISADSEVTQGSVIITKVSIHYA